MVAMLELSARAGISAAHLATLVAGEVAATATLGKAHGPKRSKHTKPARLEIKRLPRSAAISRMLAAPPH